MNRPPSPCGGCADHNARCKFDCERWKAYEKAKDEYNEVYGNFRRNEAALVSLAVRRGSKRFK